MDNRFALLGMDMQRLLRFAGYESVLREERIPSAAEARALVLHAFRELQVAPDRQAFHDRALRTARLMALAIGVATLGVFGRWREGTAAEQRAALLELQAETLLERVQDAAVSRQTIADRQLLDAAERQGGHGLAMAVLDLTRLLVNLRAECWTALGFLLSAQEGSPMELETRRAFLNKVTVILLNLERAVGELPAAEWAEEAP